ncbi:MAG: tRNA threonylcarbamoyladenosine dehydratase [Clostridia bacterium]|nr:tRNA threonylcarbamoyladenosine dehydratase [Clostridia bacterium]
MKELFSRTELLIGSEGMELLNRSRIAVFGVGGVGGYVVEALARSGVGTLDLFDNDQVCISNLNRQIIATTKTIGMDKVKAAAQRIHEINPDAVVNEHNMFFTPESSDQIDFKCYDYVVDAIDTVTGKIELVMKCKEAGVPVICSMGAGNKLHAEMFEVEDIYKTSVCPLAKVMRKELKARGIKHLKVVYSKEEPMKPVMNEVMRNELEQSGKRSIPASNAFVPGVAGLIIAGEVIQDICTKLGCYES